MILINGILCFVAAIVLLVQIKRTQDEESNQFLQKFVWLYWALLMIIAIHHIFNGLMDPWMNQFIMALDPLTDTINALVGLVLSRYLSKRQESRMLNPTTQ